jgi:SAM-dependent methyltransferase
VNVVLVNNILRNRPSGSLRSPLRRFYRTLRTQSDYFPGRAELVLNIERIDLPDKSADVVIANHVLEHVDDRAALHEIWRILADHGRLLVSVPIAGGWAKTYEKPAIIDAAGRELHFGQDDHVRYYGRDFRDRVVAAGFSVEEFSGTGEDTVQHALNRGDSIFICSKVPNGQPR